MVEHIGKVDPQMIHKWTVKMSSFTSKKIGEVIRSPVIVFSDTVHCRISLYPKGFAEEYKDYVSIYLYSEKDDFEGRVHFSILDKRGRMFHSDITDPQLFEANRRGWGFNLFIDYKRLTENFSPCDDTITFVCELIIDSDPRRKKSNTLEHEARLKEFDDFEQLIDEQKFSDVVLVFGEKKLHAHKSILMIKSEVFAAIFDHNMTENERSVVNIEDITYDVMREVLRFVYAGKVHDLEKLAMDIFVAAEKYSIEGLKKLCERHLVQNVNAENVLEYLNFASLHNAPALKDKTLDFFRLNVKKVISQSKVKVYELHKNIIEEVFCIVADSVKD